MMGDSYTVARFMPLDALSCRHYLPGNFVS